MLGPLHFAQRLFFRKRNERQFDHLQTDHFSKNGVYTTMIVS